MATDTTLLVASVRNEGPNILEWVAHHRLCGFDRIQVHVSESTDTTLKTLRILDRLGVVELLDVRGDAGDPHMRTFRRASRSEAYRDATWCMTLGCDEFLTIRTEAGTVQSLIAACPEDATTILVSSRVFGSGAERDLSGMLTTERFTQAEPAEAVKEDPLPFKTLFRTAAYGRPGVHMPRDARAEDEVICNASGLLENGFHRKNWRATDPGGRRFAQINHYRLRDLSSFLLTDGQPRKDSDPFETWVQFDRNEEEDQTLAARTFDTWAEMKRLDTLANGRLLRLRERARQQWAQSLETLMASPEVTTLADRIKSAAPARPMQTPFKLPGHAEPVFVSVRARQAEDDQAPEERKAASG